MPDAYLASLAIESGAEWITSVVSRIAISDFRRVAANRRCERAMEAV